MTTDLTAEFVSFGASLGWPNRLIAMANDVLNPGKNQQSFNDSAAVVRLIAGSISTSELENIANFSEALCAGLKLYRERGSFRSSIEHVAARLDEARVPTKWEYTHGFGDFPTEFSDESRQIPDAFVLRIE